jgi:hypothetical protein
MASRAGKNSGWGLVFLKTAGACALAPAMGLIFWDSDLRGYHLWQRMDLSAEFSTTMADMTKRYGEGFSDPISAPLPHPDEAVGWISEGRL